MTKITAEIAQGILDRMVADCERGRPQKRLRSPRGQPMILYTVRLPFEVFEKAREAGSDEIRDLITKHFSFQPK